MSICGLLFQLSVLVQYKVELIIISFKINLFLPWYSWIGAKQQSLTWKQYQAFLLLGEANKINIEFISVLPLEINYQRVCVCVCVWGGGLFYVQLFWGERWLYILLILMELLTITFETFFWISSVTLSMKSTHHRTTTSSKLWCMKLMNNPQFILT